MIYIILQFFIAHPFLLTPPTPSGRAVQTSLSLVGALNASLIAHLFLLSNLDFFLNFIFHFMTLLSRSLCFACYSVWPSLDKLLLRVNRFPRLISKLSHVKAGFPVLTCLQWWPTPTFLPQAFLSLWNKQTNKQFAKSDYTNNSSNILYKGLNYQKLHHYGLLFENCLPSIIWSCSQKNPNYNRKQIFFQKGWK